MGRGFRPHRRHCVVVFDQDTFILPWYWFKPGRLAPTKLKDCWWDVKNQIKQTSITKADSKEIITEIQTRDSDDDCQLSYREYQMLKV